MGMQKRKQSSFCLAATSRRLQYDIAAAQDVLTGLQLVWIGLYTLPKHGCQSVAGGSHVRTPPYMRSVTAGELALARVALPLVQRVAEIVLGMEAIGSEQVKAEALHSRQI